MMPAPPSGFQEVTITIDVEERRAAEKLREIERLALRGCPASPPCAIRWRSRPR